MDTKLTDSRRPRIKRELRPDQVGREEVPTPPTLVVAKAQRPSRIEQNFFPVQNEATARIHRVYKRIAVRNGSNVA